MLAFFGRRRGGCLRCWMLVCGIQIRRCISLRAGYPYPEVWEVKSWQQDRWLTEKGREGRRWKVVVVMGGIMRGKAWKMTELFSQCWWITFCCWSVSNTNNLTLSNCPVCFCMCGANCFFICVISFRVLECDETDNNLKVKRFTKKKQHKTNKLCNTFRSCLANNLPLLITAAGLGKLALWHRAATQSIWEEARIWAKSSLYLPSGASQEGVAGWRESKKSFYTLGCCLSAGLMRPWEMCFPNNWPARWQSWYYVNVNQIRKRERDLFEILGRGESSGISQGLPVCSPRMVSTPRGLSHVENSLFL